MIWIFFLCFSFVNILSRPFTVILNPAGHAEFTGRKIKDTFERSLTFDLAEKIKSHLKSNPNLRVIISRSPGEVTDDISIASFSNRIEADIFIDLNIFQSKDVDKIYIYYLMYDPTDLWPRNNEALRFYKLDEIHLVHINKSKEIAGIFFEKLNQKNENNYLFYAPIGAPIIRLKGLNCPAFSLEIGLKDSNLAKLPLYIADSLDRIIESRS